MVMVGMTELERKKVQVDIVKHLLRYRFTWEEIFEAIGFSKVWLNHTEKLIKQSEE